MDACFDKDCGSTPFISTHISSDSPLVSEIVDPEKALQNLKAVYISEEEDVSSFSSNIVYHVSDYSNGMQLFAGGITCGTMYNFDAFDLNLDCVTAETEENTSIRYLSIEKNAFSPYVTVRYIFPEKPTLLGRITDELGCCQQSFFVTEIFTKRLVYTLTTTSFCCASSNLKIFDAKDTTAGKLSANIGICENKSSVLHFPEKSTWLEKSLLIAAAIYVNIFYTSTQNRRHNN